MKTATAKTYETTDGRRIRALHDGTYIWVNGVRSEGDRITRYSGTRKLLKTKTGLLYYLNDDGKAERVRYEYVRSHIAPFNPYDTLWGKGFVEAALATAN